MIFLSRRTGESEILFPDSPVLRLFIVHPTAKCLMPKRPLLLVLSVLALGVSCSSRTADPPHIVLIISDDQA